MSDKPVKSIVAANLADLRHARGLTQLGLAEQLNYSDKAVSKWERGESLPDIETLVRLARFYDVSLDYLVQEDHSTPAARRAELLSSARHNHTIIIGISVLLVWLIACAVHIALSQLGVTSPREHLPFLYAVPVSFIVWLVLNSVWFKGRKNHIIISLLMWSVLASVDISLILFAGRPIHRIFALGVPGQLIILFWSRLQLGKARYIKVNRYE